MICPKCDGSFPFGNHLPGGLYCYPSITPTVQLQPALRDLSDGEYSAVLSHFEDYSSPHNQLLRECQPIARTGPYANTDAERAADYIISRWEK